MSRFLDLQTGKLTWGMFTERRTRHGAPRLTPQLPTDSTRSTCFICEGRLPAEAPRHYKTHSEVLASEKLFHCPECSLDLEEKCEYLSGDDMLQHLATVHNHPVIVRCALCNHFSTHRGVTTHMRGHLQTESSPVTCPCYAMASGEELPLFYTFESWHLHATGSSHHHGLPDAHTPKNSADKRKRGYAMRMGILAQSPALEVSASGVAREIPQKPTLASWARCLVLRLQMSKR